MDNYAYLFLLNRLIERSGHYMNNEKDYVIYSQRLAAMLMSNGCRLKKIKPDKDKPNFNVFFFENTNHVKELVKQYRSNRN